MTTYHKDYGVTASIKDLQNGAALLTVRCGGKVIMSTTHKSRKAAFSAWQRFCR